MCTFNGSRFVREQLDSIALQQRAPDQIVICDDNSADGTFELLQDFAASCPFPIRIVRNEITLGYQRNFQKAIQLCDGDLIALADQDDVWKPEKAESIIRTMQEHPEASYMFSDADIVDENGSSLEGTLWNRVGFRTSRQRHFSNGDQVRILLKNNVATGAAMAFRKSLKSIVFPIGMGWVHDHWIALLGSYTMRGVAVPDRLLKYRCHSGQQIGIRRPLIGLYRTALNSSAQTFGERLSRIHALQDRVQ